MRGSVADRCSVEYNPGQVINTHVPLSPSSINLVPAQAGKLTV